MIDTAVKPLHRACATAALRWVSAGIGHRSRPSAADRDRPVRELSFGLRDLDLHRSVRSGQSGSDGDDARLCR